MSSVKDLDMTPEKVQELLESQLKSLNRAEKLDPKFEDNVEKKRKQDRKEITQIVKNENLSAEEKNDRLKQKCMKLVEEVVELKQEVAREVTMCEGIKVHRDQLLKKHKKSEALCEKLQQLCRELQRQNTSIVERTEASCKEEAALRSKLKNEFQLKLDDISQKVTDQGKEKDLLQLQNKELQDKLNEVLQGYSQAENQVQEFCKVREAEKELAQLQFQKQSEIVDQKDKELQEYKAGYNALKQQCQANKSELEQYRAQYDTIQQVVDDAKKMVKEAAEEKEKMAKMYIDLTKERNNYLSDLKDTKEALSKSNNVLLKYKLDKETLEKKLLSLTTELEKTSSQRDKFADLCRVMQNQIKVARESLSTENQSE